VEHPRILAIDVGTGTQDILILEAGGVIENAVQLIMPSPTALLAERVKQATQDRVDLVLTGVTMGGGPDHWAVEAHLRAGLKVYATPDAARTFDDDLERVASMGIRLVDAPAAANGARRLELRDFYLTELMAALRAFDVGTDFDAIAVAVFDHGAAPPDVSDRRFRFEYLREQVERGVGLEGFGFLAAEIPARMTRMQAVAASWSGAVPLFLMDTGPAAILGALDDAVVAASDPPEVGILPGRAGDRRTLQQSGLRRYGTRGAGAWRQRIATGTACRHRSAPRSARRLAARSAPRGAARRHDAGRVLWTTASAGGAASRVRAGDRGAAGPTGAAALSGRWRRRCAGVCAPAR
jgi:hypothetical protein